ncbi:MAG: hypothetical protein WD871_12955 [Xanthobacteraceae bacterium]
MRISASFGTGVDPTRRDTVLVPKKAEEPLRASLPAVVPAPDRPSDIAAPKHVRPVAALLAQLVAGAEDLPATRIRRRADPGQSAQLYRAIDRLGPAAPHHAVKMV